MVQVLKQAVRGRIESAALRCFAERGYAGTSMAGIAAAAGTAPGNVYRYFPSKEALFDAVVPRQLADRHDELLDARVTALTRRSDADGGEDAAAAELLDFWLDHRLAVVVLLDRADGTPVAGHPAAFVRRLVDHVERALGAVPSPVHREVLELVFDNTRRAIARMLLTGGDRDHTSALITAYWSYQLPGRDGLMSAIRAARGQD